MEIRLHNDGTNYNFEQVLGQSLFCLPKEQQGSIEAIYLLEAVVVASDTRGPQFESSHRRTLYCIYTVNCIEKRNINIKRPGMIHFKQYI